MLNNFIYSKTKDLFLEQLNAGNILDEAVVFIEDTKEIWNHGTYFASLTTLTNDEVDLITTEVFGGGSGSGSGGSGTSTIGEI